MRLATPLMAFALLAIATAGHAAPLGEKAQETGKMVTDTVTQPLSDINLKRREIPPELLAIRDDPYALDGLRTCRAIIAEVKRLDAVLGPDFDQTLADDAGQKRRESVKTVAGGLIASLIPFRALIREVSGANKSDEAFRAAIYAGVVRRGFLKGYGQHRRCKAPGRPLNDREQMKQAEAIADARKEDDDATDK